MHRVSRAIEYCVSEIACSVCVELSLPANVMKKRCVTAMSFQCVNETMMKFVSMHLAMTNDVGACVAKDAS